MKFAGILIDSAQAVVVKIEGKSTEVVRVTAHTDGQETPKRGARKTAKKAAAATGQNAINIRRYFDHVTEAIRDCSRFYLLGPDDVKVQFKQFLERTPDFAHRIVAVESVQKMTEKQLATKVGKYFQG
jgi:hypothetical protein